MSSYGTLENLEQGLYHLFSFGALFALYAPNTLSLLSKLSQLSFQLLFHSTKPFYHSFDNQLHWLWLANDKSETEYSTVATFETEEEAQK